MQHGRFSRRFPPAAARSSSTILIAALFLLLTLSPANGYGTPPKRSLARSAQAGPVVSDDFHAAELDTAIWRFVDPVGDALLWMTGTNAVVSIPGGTNYDLRGAEIRAPRLLQSISNVDFDLEGKLDSKGAWYYQGQGIMVVEDEDTYLRFELIFGGGVTRIYSAYENAEGRTTWTDQALAATPPYLRVTRTGNSWSFRYSYNGTSWINAVSFQQPMTVTAAGVYFSSAPASSEAYWETPAFVGNVDYFFNRAAPIAPEDGGMSTVATPPVVELWYGDEQDFGHLGIPQQWVNILGRVWDTEAVDSLFYRLNGGPARNLTMGPNITRLVGVGDYNIEIDHEDLIAGANEVVITAIDELGERRDTTVTVNYTAGVAGVLPETIAFESAGAIAEVAHVVDGRWHLSAGEGVSVDTRGVGYDRLLVVGDMRWETDYEVLIPITVHAASLGGLTGIGIGLGWQGHTGSAQPRVDAPFQALTWIRDFPANPTLIIEQPGIERAAGYPPLEADVRYLMRTRSKSLGNGLSRVSTKLWEDGTPEPADWDLDADVPTVAGSVIIVAHRALATFGDVSIAPLPSSAPHELVVNIVGAGSVTKVPDLPHYADGDTVVVIAAPEAGWVFGQWSGGLTGSENPDTVVIIADTLVTATFSEAAIAIEDASDIRALVVRNSYPNPFREHILMEYGVPRTQDVEVAVYDAAGRTVYSDRLTRSPGGWNTYLFRGVDAKGRALPSGVYFCRFKTSEAAVTRKIVIVR